MARSVRGAALMLDSMAGTGDKFAAALDSADDLSALTIGVLRFSQGDNATIIDRFNKALTLLEQACDDARVWAVGHQWQQLYGPVPVPGYLSSANDEASIKTANMPVIPPSLN